ncbi:MAG TPA: transglutaminase domain-containing protein, partial [Thermoanaerobaculia bacterium]|nr:transglutaminase domain-containing protein [Thermoanaerobaculia bacterium]
IVDKQIADADLQKLVRNAIGNATDRREVVAKLLAAVQKDIRYAGVEIGEGSIVPRTPKQVLANKYGDCKDKASLLVAMLRIAGFPAHVALLNAGSGFDVLPELPSLAYFNHAIAVVDGDPAIWVDPTDVFARAGELPVSDQGRLALIARPETTTLTKTPELQSTASVYRELRTFYLPEDGKARVVEVSEPSTTSEASMRRWVSGLDAKSLREELEGYVQSAYVTKKLARYEHTDPSDLSKPFRLTLEVAESDSGIVTNGDGAVAINLGALPQQVPNALRDWEEPRADQSEEDAPKKRTHEFLFPQPQVREWVYRIIPPPGYVPRTLPPNETKKLGTSTFTQELKTEADNSVTATFRFDSGKRRLSVAEFEESRVAITKFLTNNIVTIGFDLVGQAKLNEGDVRGALDEFRRLAALHPKEAQHHIEIARALLAGGLGDAARKEIDRAIAIEPKNARAYQTLGSILLNDSLGRPFRKGFDLKGAIAALRKAKELDPNKLEIRTALSTALSYGEDGYRFGRGARLAEAVDEVLAMAKDLGEEAKGMQPELTLLYAHLGRFEDLRKLAPTLEDTQQRDLARIIATAAIDGTQAAVQELGAFDVQTRRSYASGVGQLLMQVRLYPQAAAMMDLATQGTPAAAQQRQFIDLVTRMKRVEDQPKDDGPRSVIAFLFLALLRSDLEPLAQIFPAEYLNAKNDDGYALTSMDLRVPDGFAPAVFLDLLMTMMDVQQEGDDATGYRLRIRVLGASLDDDQSLMVRRENGRWIVRGASKGEALNGDTVLAMVA